MSISKTAAVALALACCARAHADPIVLKVATLAPEGSSWAKLFHELANKLEQRTDGRVKLKIYAGGTQGDELDLLRKIKLGTLHGAAVTGIGLQAITPEARVFDLARTNEELDAFRAVLQAEVEQKFAAKGYIIGGWGDVGPIHIFSKYPIRTVDDLKKTKFWIWADDPVSKQIGKELGLTGVPLGVPEVLPGLQTGMIDTFFSSPLATLALQWGQKAKYMTTPAMATATGATILAKAAWDKLTPADQKILREESLAMQKKLLAQVRADNLIAVEQLKRQGLEVIETAPALRARFEEVEEKVARANTARVSKDFSDKVEKLVEDYRTGKITKQMIADYGEGKITSKMIDDYLAGRISQARLDDYAAGRIKLEKRAP